jgi:uncharacterized membrane protein
VRKLLGGGWLGHSLHAAITDLPIGAWTCSVVIDAMESAAGRTELRPGADAAIGIGLVGAVGAVVTGLTDFQHADSNEARRTGLVHAALKRAKVILLNTDEIALLSQEGSVIAFSAMTRGVVPQAKYFRMHS